MSLERELKGALETGVVKIGITQCRKALERNEAKLLVLATNCPDDSLRELDVKTIEFKGSNIELGQICGKPVIDEGTSNISSLA
jgi:large subunit ribosomal protein L30e